MKTVAVLGSTGFVGSAVVGRLLETGEYDVRPFIHSTGNASKLARLGIKLYMADMLDKPQLNLALAGCHYVVNCSRGSSETMLQGLRNLLHACKSVGVERFVHISSTAVYGEQFDSPVVDENHPVTAAKDTYGGKKAEQDQIILSATERGLPSVILCPPNITGPESPYMMEIVSALARGEFAFVDGGGCRCSVVDVRNLAVAVHAGLTSGIADGKRIIIADPEPQCWLELVQPLQSLVNSKELTGVTANEAQQMTKPARIPVKSLGRALRHLVSSDVRSALQEDAFWNSLHTAAVGFAKKMPAGVQAWLRRGGAAREKMSVSRAFVPWNLRLLSQQLRNVQFVSTRASSLQHTANISYRESCRIFCDWYRSQFGLDSGFQDLLGLINHA